eukprot:scaffold42872_cov51-Attheya_sp.AAC.1
MQEIVTATTHRGLVAMDKVRRGGQRGGDCSVDRNACSGPLLTTLSQYFFKAIANNPGRKRKDRHCHDGSESAHYHARCAVLVNEGEFSKEVEQGVVAGHGNGSVEVVAGLWERVGGGATGSVAVHDAPFVDETETGVNVLRVPAVVRRSAAVDEVGGAALDEVVETGDDGPGGDADEECRGQDGALESKHVVQESEGQVVAALHAHHAEEAKHAEELRGGNVLIWEERVHVEGHGAGQVHQAVEGGQVAQAAHEAPEARVLQVGRPDAQQVVYGEDQHGQHFQHGGGAQIAMQMIAMQRVRGVVAEPQRVARQSAEARLGVGPWRRVVLRHEQRGQDERHHVHQNQPDGQLLVPFSCGGLRLQKLVY